jgi:hypothetical protein
MPDTNGWSVSSALNWPPACSEWARSEHLDPVGSAGHYQGFLLVEQPLPWPFDVSTLPELVEVARLAAAAGLRLQAVKPVAQQEATKAGRQDIDDTGGQGEPPAATESLRRLVCYRSARPGWAGPLVRSERVVAPGSLAQATADVLSRDPVIEEPRGPGDQVIDVLVCTHGRRDACCGGRGMELVNEVLRDPLLGPRDGVRLWRTSHTGGHRFAPTAILLPTGTMWAWADVPLLRAAALSEGGVDYWLGRYRGCAILGSPSQQAVERAVLSEVGWALMGSGRKASDIDDGLVRLESELFGVWEAAVREGRLVPQPECKTSPELATKQSVEWVVEGLRQVVPA